MQYKPYTGIGSRSTPKPILNSLENISKALLLKGFTLRSGGAPGADSAFEKGVQFDKNPKAKEIFLPFPNFNSNPSPLHNPPPEAFLKAQQIHPHWSSCSPFAKKAHARNIQQVLGKNLNQPSLFVLFWAKESQGKVEGGTATAVSLARELKIPTFNLANPKIQEQWEMWALEVMSEKSIITKAPHPIPWSDNSPPIT